MTSRDILIALQNDEILLMMLAEGIGERGLVEDEDSDATWHSIATEVILELLDSPMGRGELPKDVN